MALTSVALTGYYGLPYLDNPPIRYRASSITEPGSGSLRNIQPAPTEWPLMVVRQFASSRPPESYVLEVSAVRETNLLRFSASSSSPERATALAGWLAEAATESLRQSYSSRGIEPRDPFQPRRPQVLGDHPAQRLSMAPLAVQFIPAVLLFLGAVVLLRQSSACAKDGGETVRV